MDKYLFALDGVWCNDMGITLQAPVTFSARVPKVNTVSVPGRNGDLHIYEGGYENISGTARCYALEQYVYERISKITKWLLLNRGYRRLEVSGEPDYFRRAMVKAGPDEAIRKGLLAPFEIQFDCDPRKFLKTGEIPVSVSNGGGLYNPGFPSAPMIELTGNGAGSFTINDVTVEIKTMEGSLTLDCDTENAYKGIENKNNTINAPVFPALEPGNNRIAWTGGVTGVRIIPRWWD